jgi:hypothetical protein
MPFKTLKGISKIFSVELIFGTKTINGTTELFTNISSFLMQQKYLLLAINYFYRIECIVHTIN